MSIAQPSAESDLGSVLLSHVCTDWQSLPRVSVRAVSQPYLGIARLKSGTSCVQSDGSATQLQP